MDGVATPEEYAFRAKALEMPAIAVTDHGGLSGHRPMYRAAKEQGIKPILGIEAYLAKDRFDKREKKLRTDPLDVIFNHLIVLAKNAKGLENLNKLNEVAWTEGFYNKPRMDFDILDKYGDDLIVSTACMGGLINQAIEQGEYAQAKNHLAWFSDRFGDDFYVELMPHNTPGMNQELYDIANAMSLKCIVTPDCHHCVKEQKEMQEFMLLLNTHPEKNKDATYEKSKSYKNMLERLDYLYPDRKLSFTKLDIHMLDYDEMSTAMNTHGNFDDSIYTNTLEIADKVEDYNLKSNLNLLPSKAKHPQDTLRRLAIDGLKARGLFDNPEYVDRLMEELDIVKVKNFAAYFLIMYNTISKAKAKGIRVGPGRGSSAGSLICYALGITDVDPIKYGLLFFRFIDIERDDFPDIDTDFQDNRREEVKQDLEDEYKNVSSIATFTKFNGKGIVKDISRVLNIPLADANRVSKQIDTWSDYCKFPNAKWFRDMYPEVEFYGNQLLGRIRSTGVHAAGVITSKEPIFKYAPMETRDKEINGVKQRIPVVAIDMNEVADIGFVKIDALGLNTLTVIDDTIKSIKARHDIDIDLHELSLDDPRIYQMLSSGNTKGVFQCEATPYTRLIVKMGVRNFDELVASNALVRPGAMNTIGAEYMNRKHGKSIVDYIHPVMTEHLKDTYGMILYQEQVMLACTTLGGMSMSEANKVRKIIGKKKDVMEFDEFKAKFVQNASAYVSPFIAESLWHDFEAHAEYSFNKSHAVAYSIISYWTAWLKFYYPLEFMFATLKSESDKDKRTEYLIECKRMGISLKLPHVNTSGIDFEIEDKSIRFGLSAAKYVSPAVAQRIIKDRPWASYADFKEKSLEKKSGINSRAVTALNSIGALALPDNPRNDTEVRKNLYDVLNLPEFNFTLPANFYSQIDENEDYDEAKAHILMGISKKIKRGKGWCRIEFLDKTGVVGIFDEADSKIEQGKTYIILAGNNRIASYINVEELESHKNHPIVTFLNYDTPPYGKDEYLVLSFRARNTKAGKKMAHMVLADWNKNIIPVVVFPSMFSQGYMKCEPGKVVKLLTNELKDGTIALQSILKRESQ
jgi:DNA polymerase-3 subunit alpha